MKKIFLFLFLFLCLNLDSVMADLAVTTRQYMSLLNQRWLLSQEIAAYQYYHALDPPEILTPALEPLVHYGQQVGLTEYHARLLIQLIHRIDQRLEQRWLSEWQQHGFNFDNGHFMNAPSLCLKQEALERQLLKKQAEIQSMHQPAWLTSDRISEGLLVPKFAAADQKDLLKTLRMMESKGV